MFDRWLPETLYENLPRLYTAAALGVALLPLSPVRWVAVAALLTAAWVTLRRRRCYRAVYLRRPATAPRLLRSRHPARRAASAAGTSCGS